MPEIQENKEQLKHRFVAFLLLAFLLIIFLFYSAFTRMPSRNPYVHLSSTVIAAETKTIKTPEIMAQAAIIYDAKNKKVLFEKNAGLQLPLASITKILLALAVSEVLDANTAVSIPAASLLREGDVGFRAGEIWRAQDLIDLTLVTSSNDGADALARAAHPYLRNRYVSAPNEHATLWYMNRLAEKIGMEQTFVTDPTGLDLSGKTAGAHGSARDVAQLMLYAFAKQPGTVTATAQGDMLFKSTSGIVYEVQNTNDVLGEIPNLIAGKTGFTDLAGGNLAIIFDASIGHPVVVVVLGSGREGRFNDVKILTEHARRILVAQN